MSVPLRVLFVEDNEDDLLLQLRELRRGGYEPSWRRVQMPEALRAALASEPWDVVVSDFAMPGMNGLDALREVQRSGLDLPFILCSGTVGEDVAVDCVKAGANDYLLKDNLQRLVPAIERELRDAASRQARRDAERGLSESQSLLRLVFDHADEMYLLWEADEQGVLRAASMNPAWLRFAAQVGKLAAPAAFLGADLPGLLDALGATGELRERLLRGGKALHEPLLGWPTTNGERFLELRAAPVPATEGGHRHLLWAARDVTERKQAEDQQRRLEAERLHCHKLQTLGTVASSIAHDFANVLVGLGGHADLLRYHVADRPLALELLGHLQQGTERATQLVQHIMAFARNRPAVPRRPVALLPLAEEALAFLRPLAPPSVRFVLAHDGSAPRIEADAGQINQVLVNLCTNAIHALAGRSGELSVSVGTGASRVRLVVRDTGVGMDKATLSRMFKAFFTTRAETGGTGLGLKIVKDILDTHGAEVAVDSEPGQGTAFTILFPPAG